MLGIQTIKRKWQQFKDYVGTTVVEYIKTYAGAQSGRLFGDWLADNLSANEEIHTSLKKVRERARQQERDNSYIKKFLELEETNIIGDSGIRLNMQVKNDQGKPEGELNTRIENEWKLWGMKGSCEVSGALSWVDVQNLAVRNWKRDGETLVRLIPGFNNDYSFAVQIIEADLLDEELNINPTSAGTKIRMGIELDVWNRPINYWMLTDHPGGRQIVAGRKHNVIPANQIIHIYKTTRAGMVRGISQVHASMASTHMLDQFEEAELVSARIQACVTIGLVRSTQDFQGDATEFADGAQNFEMAPGRVWDLPEGSKLEMFDPNHPNPNYPMYVKMLIRKIASGLGVSYESISNDLEGVTFSSIRSGKIEERDSYKKDQQFMIDNFCNLVFIRWAELQILRGSFGRVAASRIKNIVAGLEWQGRERHKHCETNTLRHTHTTEADKQ